MSPGAALGRFVAHCRVLVLKGLVHCTTEASLEMSFAELLCYEPLRRLLGPSPEDLLLVELQARTTATMHTVVFAVKQPTGLPMHLFELRIGDVLRLADVLRAFQESCARNPAGAPLLDLE